MTKNEILRIRLSGDDKELIRAAAAEAGLSMSDFLLRAGLEAAGRSRASVFPGPKVEPTPGQLTLSGGLTLNPK